MCPRGAGGQGQADTERDDEGVPESGRLRPVNVKNGAYPCQGLP
jgi:hypothetical protein